MSVQSKSINKRFFDQTAQLSVG